MKITVKYLITTEGVRVWDRARDEYGQFDVVDWDTFERMCECEFLIMIDTFCEE